MSITVPTLNESSNESREPHLTLGSRIIRLLRKPARLLDRRTRQRLSQPPLRAYLGVVGSTAPFPVGNISNTGFYMLTSEQWHTGTCLPLRLERTDQASFAAMSRMVVQTCVVRKDTKGVGFLFLPINQPEEQRELSDNPDGVLGGTRWADQKAIDDMLVELETMQSSGQAPN